jgi:hypothetical protein
MKKFFAFLVVCMLVSGPAPAGYCQYERGPGDDDEQTESNLDQNLSSESQMDEMQAEGEVAEMEASMDDGGATN